MRAFYRLLGISAVVVLLDRISKRWVLAHFVPGQSRPMCSYFSLTFVQNTGTAFGLLQRHNRLLIFAALFILIGLLYMAWELCEKGGVWAFIGVSLVVGGAIGNIVDRWMYGHVIDFLDFRVWPVFNLADSAITVGAVCLGIGLLRRSSK